MKRLTIFAATCAGLVLMAASAKADIIQTWELTALVTSTTGGFTPPAGFDIGDIQTIDYSFDLSLPFETEDQPDAYVSTLSMTFNGTLLAGSPVLAWGTGSANLNQNPGIDGVTLAGLGFNFPSPLPVPNVLSALDDIESGASAGEVTLQLQFADLASPGTAYATVTSFEPVPEPNGIAVFAIALVASTLAAKRRRTGGVLHLRPAG